MHTIEVVDVTDGDDGLRVYRECHASHEFGDGLLIVVTIASHVVDPVEADVGFQFFPLGWCLRTGRENDGYGEQKCRKE